MRSSLIIALGLALSACASTNLIMDKPGVDLHQYNLDRADCGQALSPGRCMQAKGYKFLAYANQL